MAEVSQRREKIYSCPTSFTYKIIESLIMLKMTESEKHLNDICIQITKVELKHPLTIKTRETMCQVENQKLGHTSKRWSRRRGTKRTHKELRFDLNQ